MIRCKISPSACKQPDKPCCAYCPDETCKDRCRNSTDLCNRWVDTEAVSRGVGRKYDWGEIARLHAEGLSRKGIARRLGCAPSTVREALAKMKEGRTHE